ncbi:outer membrane beta-barrel protein [Spongiimicrobium sp. 3-5]|uniref:outer membrane beta-barrel protein n=1 Tax=Spongiimicrobium sp. 3-5 TaxID=3332596 RepID=UPI00397EAE95
MEYRFLLLFLVFTVTTITAQTEFDSGYFISDNNKKIDCLIKNEKWLSSPKRIFYKIKPNGESQYFTVKNVKEFAVYGESVYRRATGDFPITNAGLKNDEANPNIKLAAKTEFVRQLVSGKAQLYVYSDGNGAVYLYKKDNGPIVPLIFKRYVASDNLEIRENNAFRRQLLEHLACDKPEMIQRTKYSKKSLIQFFKKYNTCVGIDVGAGVEGITLDSTGTGTKSKFSLSLNLWAGAQEHSFDLEIFNDNQNYKSETTLKLGAELEGILPFNNNKWSVFLGTYYSNYETEYSPIMGEVLFFGDEFRFNMDLTILENMFGLRHYMFLDKKNSLFLEGGVTLDFLINSTFNNNISEVSNDPFVIADLRAFRTRDQSLGIGAGVGYNYNKWLYFRLNYHIGQDVVKGLPVERNQLTRVSGMVGFKI